MEGDRGDEQPPDDDDQPWQRCCYRPVTEVAPTLTYVSEEWGTRCNVLDPHFTKDIACTKLTYVHGMKAKVSPQIHFLQEEKRRIREIRAGQIEKAVGTKVPIFRPPHPCILKEAHMLIRVTIPYSKNGALLLGSFPGVKSERHELASHHPLPTISPEVDFVKKKPDQLTHFAIYTAGK